VELKRCRSVCLAGALAVLVSGAPANACINDFATDRKGRVGDVHEPTGRELATQLTIFIAEDSEWVREAYRYRDRALNAPSYENATNLGVSLVYQGHYVPAIRLFLSLERLFPGRPQTAANLGTALELAGHDAVALRWIRIGIERDPGEHEGTEWLHARILEARLADAAGRWDRRSSIAGIAFDRALIPALPKVMPAGNDGAPVRPYGLDRAFRYQLRERMQFVRPKDWVVANLLSDWATLNLAGGPLENAKSLHVLALRYGEPQTLLWAQRFARIDRIMRRSDSTTGTFDCPICDPPPLPAPPAPRVPQRPPPPPLR